MSLPIENFNGVLYKNLANLKNTHQKTIDAVLLLYGKGHSQNYIERELRMTRKTIRTILSTYGTVRNKSEQSYYHHITSTLREDAFDIINDEVAYWIGFLYADGYITNPENCYNMGLLLKGDDKPHVEKFKEFLKAPQEIRSGETILNGKTFFNVSMKVGSQRLHKRLQELGFSHNKSYDAKPPEFLKYNRHFWRGVIDGDGFLGIVGKREHYRLYLCGTVDIVSGFKEFLLKSGIFTNAQIIRKKNSSLHIFQIGDNIAQKVTELLYKDSTIYLERKYQKYLEFMKNND